MNWELIRQIDESLLIATVSLRNDFLNALMNGITYFGSAQLLIPLTLLFMFLFFRQGAYEKAKMLLALLLAWAYFNYPLKALFSRVRPDIVEALVMESSPAFPSGHTLGAALILPALLITLADRPYQKKALLMVMVAILAVAVSRVYLGAHWPSDVLASLLGTAAFWFVLQSDYKFHFSWPKSEKVEQFSEQKKTTS
ncbi:phosphatase PAP2 family protein [Heliorestis acidaminivorans]|uniref:Phosphatase PAP2 family protein n=1 Tax=Heliorestis acidaminivorans TaxID=553427 RepID=A0A6I0EW43_9FIRM|nr:phosphatase PAP2 family protein [Heliorestis acidaminivorans]KAB2951288.1 phosphatase PAP2 family protein [Heliorestis acidaminivorans]